jgi:hypothetical protein
METDRYYRHSGRFSPSAVALALAAGLLAAVPMAFVYSYGIVYIPIVGMVSFLLTAGFAAIVGFATGWVLRKGKVRNHGATLAAALPVALFALWAAWVTWVYATLHRADAEVGLLDLVVQPTGLWNVITIINEKGAWSLKGLTPTGGLLWGLWALEAGLIVGMVVWVARECVNLPFCEPCDRWCDKPQVVATLGPTSKDALAPRLEKGDYAVLGELPAATALAYTRLDLHQCAQCQATTTLTATSVTVTGKKGKQEKKEKTLVKYLLVPPGELSAMRSVLAESGLRAGAAA